MSSFMTMMRLMKNRKEFCQALGLKLCHSRLTKILPDKMYLKTIYYLLHGKRINFNNPKTFNEKLQWLKLYNRCTKYHKMVDKYDAKVFAASIIGEEYIIPTIGIWDSFEDIDFEELPSQFVLKCTHDSGSVVVCKDKNIFDKEKARKVINKGLSKDLFWFGREWPYKGLKRRVIAEQYMEDSSTKELRDYKFFCFNGKLRCYKIDFDRFIEHRANYYDANDRLLRFGEAVCPPDFTKQLEIPKCIGKMKELAEQLAKDEVFLRVDFYDVNGKIYFGELTFFPASGFGAFIPEEWDLKLGDWMELNNQIS